MSSLIDIQQQIAELEAQAQQIKASQFNEKLAMVKETMSTYGITIEHLQGKPAKYEKAKSKTPAPAKYTGPNGESWSGRGLTPKWISRSEKDKSEFLITKQQAVHEIISTDSETMN